MEIERKKMPVSVQLILQKENQVLFLRRSNTGFEDGKYGFVGGHVEENENIKRAMIREAKEEIGIEIKEEDLEVKHVMDRRIGEKQYIDFVLTTNKWQGEPKIMEPQKCDELIWKEIQDIPSNTIDFERSLLKDEHNFYIPWGWEK